MLLYGSYGTSTGWMIGLSQGSDIMIWKISRLWQTND